MFDYIFFFQPKLLYILVLPYFFGIVPQNSLRDWILGYESSGGGSLNKTELSTFRLCVVFVFVLPVNRGWQIRIMMGKKKNIDINQMWNQVRCSLSWLARVRTRPGGKEKEPGQAPLTAGGRENKGCWINQTQSSAWPEARGELACSKGSQEKGGTQSPTRNGLPDKSKHKAGPGLLWDYILASLLALLPNHLSAKNTGS